MHTFMSWTVDPSRPMPGFHNGATPGLRPAPAFASSEHGTLDRRAWACLLSSVLVVEDPTSPGAAYQRLHARLVSYFATKGAADPGALADLTFDRLALKLVRAPIVVHKPASYLVAMARLVWLEQVKVEVVQRQKLCDYEAVWADDETGECDRRAAVLARCLDELSSDDRTLLLAYYQSTGDARIAGRHALTQRLGVSCTALRMRVSRLRAQVRHRALQLMAE